MVTLAEKTPLYDLLVWMINSPEAIVAVSKGTEGVVNLHRKQLRQGSMKYMSHYSIGDNTFNLSYVIRTEIRQSMKEVRIPCQLEHDHTKFVCVTDWEIVPVYLEDEDD